MSRYDGVQPTPFDKLYFDTPFARRSAAGIAGSLLAIARLRTAAAGGGPYTPTPDAKANFPPVEVTKYEQAPQHFAEVERTLQAYIHPDLQAYGIVYPADPTTHELVGPTTLSKPPDVKTTTVSSAAHLYTSDTWPDISTSTYYDENGNPISTLVTYDLMKLTENWQGSWRIRELSDVVLPYAKRGGVGDYTRISVIDFDYVLDTAFANPPGPGDRKVIQGERGQFTRMVASGIGPDGRPVTYTVSG